MVLNLETIARNPQDYQFPVSLETKEEFLLRPLEKKDETKLAELIESLSLQTRKFYSYTEPASSIAREHCEAINKYDKLRFVLEKVDNGSLIGLFEFSFSIPQGDLDRFEKYGIKLSEKTDCRIGPLLSDSYQSQGIASAVFPKLIIVAKQFDKTRIILWGGVMQGNPQAIRFYEKNGFKNVGSFVNQDGINCFDMVLSLS